MKVLPLFALLLALAAPSLTFAQGTPVPATDDSPTAQTTDASIEDLLDDTAEPDPITSSANGSMFEFGLRPSYVTVAGDVNSTGGYGVGAHIRKSLDHMFSLRLDGFYGAMSGDNRTGQLRDNRRHETRYYSGTLLGLVTLNNFRFEGGVRNINIYALAGGGANSFKTAYQQNQQIALALNRPAEDVRPFDEDNVFGDDSRNPQVDGEIGYHAAAGAGIAFRLGRRVNLGLEYQAQFVLSDRADRVDGYGIGSTNNDVVNIFSLSANFNIGSSSKLEPRYWENPFGGINDRISSVEGRINDAVTDSDGDGVVDAVDVDPNTPAGVPVNTRGEALDSDRDGVPDYRDFEPFVPVQEGEEIDENGVIRNSNRKPITESRVQEMIDASLARFQQQNAGGANTTQIVTGNGAIYLPMLYFPLNQATIRYSDYGTLSSIARVIEGNPGLNLVVRGYTDRTGTASGNQVLSYRRARNVIDHLVSNHGIDRGRLILQYRGEENAIVPLNQTQVNRRVEFLPADAGQQEDPAPAGAGSGSGGY